MVDINRAIFSLNREQEERHTIEAAKKLGVSYVDLANYAIPSEVLDLISKEEAMENFLVPYLRVGSNVKVASLMPKDPKTEGFIKNLSEKTKLNFSQVMVSKSGFIYGILAYEKKEMEKRAKEDESKGEKSSFEDQIKDIESAVKVAKSVSTTELLDVLMVGAIKMRASDIHIEPYESGAEVRYRIDGVLQEVIKIPLASHRTLLSRVKFLAKMKIDNNNPQDGRFSWKQKDGDVDLRVSTMPSSAGEAIVIRILGQEKELLELEALGFRPEALSVMMSAITKPHGMILTSGPTGSGKTSTLYAILKKLNKESVKIITLEDPVEYRIGGIEQSQIDKAGGYGFAEGLRSSLRQDPDIIMVGEIRDLETAEIAIQAALTGHLVLSTVHANSAPSVFARLLDIGVKPFLLSGSINLVMAQRLVRKVCKSCAEEYKANDEEWEEIKKTLLPVKESLPDILRAKLSKDDKKLLRGKGCKVCGESGFSGREVIIEALVPDENIEGMIKKGASLIEFNREAKERGMVTMEQDGLMKALSGSTTVDEVWRVTRE